MLPEKYLTRLSPKDRRAIDAAANCYARKIVLKHYLDAAEMDELYAPGEPYQYKPYELVLEEWAPEVETFTGEETGYTKRVKGRPLAEILKKLSSGLEDAGFRIDEYFDVGSDARYTREWTEWPANVRRVAVFAVEGGSEGHYVHVDVYTPNKAANGLEVTNVFLLKTFLGMEHALRLSNELTRLLHRAC